MCSLETSPNCKIKLEIFLKWTAETSPIWKKILELILKCARQITVLLCRLYYEFVENTFVSWYNKWVYIGENIYIRYCPQQRTFKYTILFLAMVLSKHNKDINCILLFNNTNYYREILSFFFFFSLVNGALQYTYLKILWYVIIVCILWPNFLHILTSVRYISLILIWFFFSVHLKSGLIGWVVSLERVIN